LARALMPVHDGKISALLERGTDGAGETWAIRDAVKGIRHEQEIGGRRHKVRELDMETLVCTRCRGFPLARLAERLRCPRCGCRKVAVIFEPPGGVARVA